MQLLVATLSIASSSFVAALSLSSTPADPRFVLKSSTPAPDGWFKTGRPDPSLPITLRFALAQPNFSKLEEHLLTISDPSNSRWREHLSKEDVDALVAPHEESVQFLNEYIAYYGLESSAAAASGDWHLVETNISVAETLLNAEYYVFEHTSTGKQVVRTTAYSVPEYLDDHIDVVQPTDYFGSSTRALVSPVLSSFRGEEGKSDSRFDVLAKTPTRVNITLQVLKDLYRVGDHKPSGKHTQFGITGYAPPPIIHTIQSIRRLLRSSFFVFSFLLSPFSFPLLDIWSNTQILPT